MHDLAAFLPRRAFLSLRVVEQSDVRQGVLGGLKPFAHLGRPFWPDNYVETVLVHVLLLSHLEIFFLFNTGIGVIFSYKHNVNLRIL